MKENKTPTWLTSEMEEKGLTLQVHTYLTCIGDKLPTLINLTWTEFMYLWLAAGESFESSQVFKKWIDPIRILKNDKKGHQLFEKIQTRIAETPAVKELFIKVLPFGYALQIATERYEVMGLWSRASSKNKKQLLLEKLREGLPLYTFDSDSLRFYYKITEGFVNDRIVVNTLIAALITHEPQQAYFLATHIVFNEVQIAGLCKVIEKNPNAGIDIRNLISLYCKYEHPALLGLIVSKISSSAERILDLVVSEINKSRNTEEVKTKFFTIFHKAVMQVGFAKFQNRHTVTSFLPAYQEDCRFDEILDAVVSYYETYEFNMTADAFLVWYKYKQREAFISLYKKSIPVFHHERFAGAIQVFQLCKDESVIDAAIDIGIPLTEEVDDDFAFFMTWLKNGATPWYSRVKETIVSGGYISKWWKKLRGPNDRDVKYFLSIVSHFE